MAFCAARRSPTTTTTEEEGRRGGRYCVCDPITNQWAFLPRNDTSARCLAKGKKSYELDHPRFFSFNNNNKHHHHHHHHPVDVEEEADDIEGFIALVENGVCTQYKLVVPAGYLYGSDRVHALDIFCYQTGVWTRVEIELPIPLHGRSLSKPFALGGKLHWPDYVDEQGFLLVYDPFRDDNDDEAQLVPLPDGRSSDHEVHSRMCGVSGGVVQYYEVAAHHHHTHIVVKVWELADSTSGWLVKHRVSWGGVWSKDDELLL